MQMTLPGFRDLIGEREVLFCGDLDPPDLLIFAWLRTALHPSHVIHFGVNDFLLDELAVVIPDSYTIALHTDEAAAIPRLEEVLPEWRDIVGPRSAELLLSSRKIEQEAVVSALGSQAPLLELLARRATR